MRGEGINAMLRGRLRLLRDRTMDVLCPWVADLKILAAKSLILHMKAERLYPTLHQAEFKVFSQFGEDGIIQYLIHHLRIQPDVFIEFGVHNYTESNTRFLLLNDNWRGLILDGSAQNIEHVKGDAIYWMHDLTAVQAFIDRDNINRLFSENGFTGDIGILSIDIDGNDYWVWETISVVNPVVVIVEYNSLFGSQRAMVVPYDPRFARREAHHSHQYWGASLKALCLLGQRKGYELLGCTSAGNNAFFVRSDRIGTLRGLDVAEGYVLSRFRDSRDESGGLTFLPWKERLQLISRMPVVDLEKGAIVEIGDTF